MRFVRILPAALAALMVLLAGCSKPSAPGASGQTRGPAKQEILVEEVTDRLISEMVLFQSTVQGSNVGTVASLAGRMELPLEERLGRAWKSNALFGLVFRPDDTRDSYSFAGFIGLMASMTRDFVNEEGPSLSESAKNLSKRIRLQTTETSKRPLGEGNPQFFLETIREEEKKFNLSIDEAGAQKLVKLEQRLFPQIVEPCGAKLPGLRERLVRVLQADPELLATMREAMTVERTVPDGLRQSREQADRIIASARQKQ